MNKFEETINEMKEDIADLEEDFKLKSANLDDETREKAAAAVEKTKAAINNSIEKVTAVIDEIKDDEKLDAFLDKVKAKSMEAVDYTKNRIDEIANKTSDQSLEQLHNDVMAEFDRIKESDTIKKTTEFLKDIDVKINEWFEKPEVQSAIKKAKITTVNVAEKGVEGLKKVLLSEKTTDNEENKEEQE